MNIDEMIRELSEISFEDLELLISKAIEEKEKRLRDFVEKEDLHDLDLDNDLDFDFEYKGPGKDL
jgi:hypothetical protein